MQLDVRDAMADRYRDRAVDAARRAGLEAVAERLAAWDLEARGDSQEAALFYLWHSRIRRAAARSLYSAPAGAERTAADGPAGWFPRDARSAVLERRALPWVHEGAGEAYESVAARAMADADSIAGGRRWGALHHAVAEHALGSVSVRDRALRLSVGGVPHAGSATTVNAASFGGAAVPLVTRHGPSQRHVVDLGDIDGAGGFVLPTGQSGIPFSRHYRDQFAIWRSGGLWRIPLDRRLAARAAVHRMTLQPQ